MFPCVSVRDRADDAGVMCFTVSEIEQMMQG